MASKELLQKALNANFDLTHFHRNVLQPVFGASLEIASAQEVRALNASEKKLVRAVRKYGKIKLTDYRELDLYDVELEENVIVERNKVSIGSVIKKYIIGTNAVLVNFHYGDSPDKSWRLSFIAKEHEIEDGEIKKSESNPKRYTYVLGAGETCRTAAERFAKLSLETEFTVDNIKEAFSVEKLSKLFFDEYKKHYEEFVAHLNKREIKATVFKGDEKAIRDFAKKLLGRIVFLCFVQKKGWLGATNDKWEDGDKNFLQNLFIDSGSNESFYPVWLHKLFYNTLNSERKNDAFELPDKRVVKIPYLNGGLFEDDEPKGILTFPKRLFENLFEFFNQYNFTIYEDSPEEHTIAVDPEMLGHIFENLLEDNKDKGAFYTPAEIVHYMCQESITEYLFNKLNYIETDLGDSARGLKANSVKAKPGQIALRETQNRKNIDRTHIEDFVKNKHANDFIFHNARDIDRFLDEVKICDPAIGSGAFPMGLLHEIYQLKMVLHDFVFVKSGELFHIKDYDPLTYHARVKENIIQNSIYGVDIEKGAVDIARLRFWLSLVVDENTPRALPNLDYKIVVGDSLLPRFDGVVVDIEWDTKESVSEGKKLREKIKEGLIEIAEKQNKFFSPKANKGKLQIEIRDLKINLLINQLSFDKLKFADKTVQNQNLFGKTDDEKIKETETKLKLSGYSDLIGKLEKLRSTPSKNLQFFDWKLDFPEIMNPVIAGEKQGFDIVIANPPYVGQKGHKEIFIPFMLNSKWKNFYERKQDLYYYFIVIAIELLNKEGVISYIIPPYFTTAFAGKNLRKFISKNSNIQKIINLSEHLKVFEDVSINNLILFLEKKLKSNKIKIYEPDLQVKVNHSNVFDNLKTIESNFSTDQLGGDSWNLFKTKDDFEINTDNNDTAPLGSISVISPGIQTGCDRLTDTHIETFNLKNLQKGDGIFVISNEEKNRINFSKEELNFIKPFYKNSAISKWTYETRNKYWVIITNKINKINDYPNIKNHLIKFKKILDARYRNFALKNADKDGKWWYLYGFRPNTNFEDEKIVLPYRSENNSFAYSDKKFYSSIDIFYINSTNTNYSLKYINAILCSNFIFYWLKKNCKKKGRIFELYQDPLSRIPIKNVEPIKQTPFIILVDKILEAKKENPEADTSKWEKQIDLMVYHLYNLTYEEAKIIDAELSEEEWEKYKS